MTKQTEWVVVADAARARIFEIEAKQTALPRSPLREMTAEIAPSRELASDRPGRTFDSAGEGRHAKEPPTDPHRYEKRRFAHELAQVLEDGRKAEAFGQLVIVAPPQMLGDLRDEVSQQVKALIRAEIPKDLSMLPAHELDRHLEGTLRR